MKFKKLIALAASSLLATSFAYAEPSDVATMDDGMMNGNPMQEGMNFADNNIGADPGAPTSTMDPSSPQSTDPSAAQGGDASAPGSSDAQSPADSTNSNDDSSADTATGDDDY